MFRPYVSSCCQWRLSCTGQKYTLRCDNNHTEELLDVLADLCVHAYLFATTCALVFTKVLLLQTQLYDFCSLPLPVSLQSESTLEDRSQRWRVQLTRSAPSESDAARRASGKSGISARLCVSCLVWSPRRVSFVCYAKAAQGLSNARRWETNRMKRTWGWKWRLRVSKKRWDAARFGIYLVRCCYRWLIGSPQWCGDYICRKMVPGSNLCSTRVFLCRICMFCWSVGWLPPTVKDM